MIKKVGKEWILYTKDGKKILGKHKSRRDAKLQEIAININKHKKD